MNLGSNKIHYSEDAKRDLKNIYKYTFHRYGERQAVQYDDNIKSSIGTLEYFPKIGRRFVASDGREFLRYNSGRHAIFYLEQNDGVLIVRLLHGHMNFDHFL